MELFGWAIGDGGVRVWISGVSEECFCIEVHLSSGWAYERDRAVADTSYRQTKFASFPEVFIMHAKKLQLVYWVLAKLSAYSQSFPLFLAHEPRAEISIALPSKDPLQLTAMRPSTGLKPEEELPEEPSSSTLLSLKKTC